MAWWLLQTAWLGDGIWNRAHFGHPKVGSIPWCWLVQRQAHAYRLPLRLKHRLRSSPKGLHCNWSMSVTKRIPAVTTLRSRAFYGNWTTRCPVTCPNWCWKTNGDGSREELGWCRTWRGMDEAWRSALCRDKATRCKTSSSQSPGSWLSYQVWGNHWNPLESKMGIPLNQ